MRQAQDPRSGGVPGGGSEQHVCVPAPLVSEVRACSFPSWFPIFKRHTARSEIIPLPKVSIAPCQPRSTNPLARAGCSLPPRKPLAGVSGFPPCGRRARLKGQPSGAAPAHVSSRASALAGCRLALTPSGASTHSLLQLPAISGGQRPLDSAFTPEDEESDGDSEEARRTSASSPSRYAAQTPKRSRFLSLSVARQHIAGPELSGG